MKILVPLDGSSLAESAVTEAERMVRTCDGEIILLTVGEVAETSEHRHEEHSVLREIVDPVAERLTGVRVSVRTDMGGDPVEGIIRAAQDEDVDQIVMSTHGRSGLSLITHGSVADGVLRRSPVPVTLVRPGGPQFEAQRALMESADCRDFIAAAASLQRGGFELSAENVKRLRDCLDDLPELEQLHAAEVYLRALPIEERRQTVVQFIERGNDARREAALGVTYGLGEEVIPALVSIARASEAERRWAAYQAIRRVDGEAAIAPLVEALQDDNLSVRWIASDGLAAIGPRSAPALLRALATRTPTINFHRAARRVLRQLELPHHEASLTRLLSSLEQSTTVVHAPGLAQELLREIERDAPAM